MKTAKTPADEHTQFDQLCAQLGEWETLPAVTSKPTEHDHERSDEDRTSELDGQILAGLVSP